MAYGPQHHGNNMGTQTSFNLNDARGRWRKQLAAAGLTTVEIEELQSHVTETTDGLRRQGLSEEESFWVAARRLGPAPALGAEFAAADPWRYWSERIFWAAALGLAIYFLMSATRIVFYVYDVLYWLYLLTTGWWDHYLNGAWGHHSTDWPGSNGYPKGMMWFSLASDLLLLAVTAVCCIRFRESRLLERFARRLPPATALARWLVKLTAGLVSLQIFDWFLKAWPGLSTQSGGVNGALSIGLTLLSSATWPAVLVTLLLVCRPASDSSFGSSTGNPLGA